jgi:hypothetical protein
MTGLSRRCLVGPERGVDVTRPESPAVTNVGRLSQRVVSRNALTFRAPQAVFWFLIVDILWEVVKENRPQESSPAFPWWFTVFNLSTGVTAAGIFGSLLIARSQFARAIRPALGFFTDERAGSIRVTLPARWTVRMTNGGPGACTVRSCEWRYALPGQEAEGPWLSWQDAIVGLKASGIAYGRHYYLINLGPGAVLSGNASQQLEIGSFSERAVSVLDSLEIRINVIDLAGDVHERIGDLLHSARSITGIAPDLAHTVSPAAEAAQRSA